MEQKENQSVLKSKTDFDKVATENFSKWNELIKTGDPQQVANLYTEDSIFLPTISGDFKKGQDGAKEYFIHFLEKRPEGKIIESVAQIIDEQNYLHLGRYDFEVGPQDNRTTLHARFTFFWRRDKEGNWKIAHHHSSLNPEK